MVYLVVVNSFTMHHHITEDTPPDMLAGAMDLVVRLPDGRDVNMAVERSTPMMDLLVHLTTANKLRPSDHILQALDMSMDRTLPYKPNTPIGALDTQRIRVIPKGAGKGLAPRVPIGQQPFESTFRLQVHLPRNQFCVIRVGKNVLLENIMKKVCEEKNLDPKKYEFRHPANIDKVLDPKRTLNDYEITEITVVHRGSSGHLSQALSSTDIMALQREEERRKQAKTGGGVLNLIFKRGRNSMGSGSISSDTRSISPTQSDDSRSVTPPVNHNQPPQILKSPSKESVQNLQSRPKPPQRKRRPAPKPPTPINQEKSSSDVVSNSSEVPKNMETEKCQEEIPAQKLENGLTICHSRNSSDSSGYHEASILSDNCNTTLPRRPKSVGINNTNGLINNDISAEQKSDFRKSTGNLANMMVQSKSTMSLTTAGRKKKAPPPPPSLSSANSAASINSSISSPPNSDIAEVIANASSNSRIVEPSKLHSDNESTALTKVENIPKPKPRTIKAPVPVPTPRRLFTETNQQIQSLNNSPRNSLILDEELVSIDNFNDELKKKLVTEDSFEDSFMSDKETNLILEDEHFNPSSTPINKESKFDTAGRTRGFKIGQSMLSIDSSEDLKRNVSSSSLYSFSSSPDINENADNFNNLQIENIDLFENNRKRSKKIMKQYHKTQNLVEINDLRQNKTYQELLAKSPSNSSLEFPNNESLLSLRSMTNLPGFMDNEIRMRKWENLQSLDISTGDARNINASSHWVLGDPSDADSIGPATPTDSSSLPRNSDVSLHTVSLTTDTALIYSAANPKRISVTSSYSQEENKTLSSQVSTVNIQSPRNSLDSSSADRRESLKIEAQIVIPQEMIKINDVVQKSAPEERKASFPKKVVEIPVEEVQCILEEKSVNVNKINEHIKIDSHDSNELDTEWQYTLPSPPTAFRDSSPTNFTDVTNYDTVTFNGLTNDSIVTSPALFEKLESISHTRSEIEEDTVSNSSSVKKQNASEKDIEDFKTFEKSSVKEENTFEDKAVELKQEEVLTSKYLSLETLEKRKSLVLERELASLKIAQTESVPTAEQTIKSQRDSLKNEMEEVFQNKSRSATLSRTNSQSREKILISATDSTLPNFKITTYDQPKNKINIFEDDSIRSSNIDLKPSRKLQPTQSEDINILKKRNSLASTSTENIYFAKRNSMDDFLFKKPEVPVKFNKNVMKIISNDSKNIDIVSRSESFSTQKHIWSRSNPVKRSKSHISLDKYTKEECPIIIEDGLHKSNSLYNVSGLQSLEVMRMILPKLGNTPPNSPSEDKKDEPFLQKTQSEPVPFVSSKPEVEPLPSIETPSSSPPKKYQYSGPPAINFATWSDRPKTQVSIKEDTDYKFSNIKAKFNGSTYPKPQENISSKPSENISYPPVNIRVNSNNSKDQVDSGKINIKINSIEETIKPISQTSGNVVIKIGSTDNKTATDSKSEINSPYTRFLNQTTAVGYRKPLGNINGVDKPRPHSIAFDESCADLSRVPIVRAVELKKPYKESQGNNKSITQILHDTSFDLSHQNVKNGTEHQIPIKNQNHNQHVNSPIKSNTLGNQYRHSSVYLSNENINKSEQNGPNKVLSVFSLKPISRGNSFATSRTNGNMNTAPVVKGFRETDSKKIFNFNNPKSIDNYVPFSQNNLKRTENTIQKQVSQPERSSIFETVTLRKTGNRHSMPTTVEINSPPSSVPVPPPAPQMPKLTGLQARKPIQRQLQVQDSRDQLLESIRNFGGKSGLKAAKQ